MSLLDAITPRSIPVPANVRTVRFDNAHEGDAAEQMARDERIKERDRLRAERETGDYNASFWMSKEAAAVHFGRYGLRLVNVRKRMSKGKLWIAFMDNDDHPIVVRGRLVTPVKFGR